jgi:hypothetical protein
MRRSGPEGPHGGAAFRFWVWAGLTFPSASIGIGLAWAGFRDKNGETDGKFR